MSSPVSAKRGCGVGRAGDHEGRPHDHQGSVVRPEVERAPRERPLFGIVAPIAFVLVGVGEMEIEMDTLDGSWLPTFVFPPDQASIRRCSA